jgi:hypothetical protein
MKHTVLWTPIAEQRLAAIWMSATDRNSVTSAAHAIDKALRPILNRWASRALMMFGFSLHGHWV